VIVVGVLLGKTRRMSDGFGAAKVVVSISGGVNLAVDVFDYCFRAKQRIVGVGGNLAETFDPF